MNFQAASRFVQVFSIFVLALFVSSQTTIAEDGGTAKIAFTDSNLPILVIDADSQRIPQDRRIVARLAIIDNPAGMRNVPADSVYHFESRITIEIRGSSSTSWRKKQYNFETQNEDGSNLNVSLLGLPAENDWVLNAPYIDKSLMRNVLAYRLFRDMGWYASRTRYCEVVLDGEYKGIYVLMEKVKRDKNRVDISTLNPEEVAGDDLTGGYIIKVDKPGDDAFPSLFPPFAGTERKVFYQYHYPKDEDIVAEQRDYIRGFIAAFEARMRAAEQSGSESFLEVIDPATFVDFFIVNEVAKNVDGYRLSTFLHKDRDSVDGRLKMGPVWDFNLAFGNANYFDAADVTDWQLDNLTTLQSAKNDPFPTPFWWRVMMRSEQFSEMIRTRWNELRSNVLSRTRIRGLIDSIADSLDEAQVRNFEIWSAPGEGGEGFWPVPGIFYSFETYQDEVDYLKSWTSERITWMDGQISGLAAAFTPEVIQAPNRFTVSQNFPNPFTEQTRIIYGMPFLGNVKIEIFNALGEHVITLVDELKHARLHEATWDGRNSAGQIVASGVYFMRVRWSTQTTLRKLVKIR